MKWTEQDELALEECRDCIRRCTRERFVQPAPWFPLAVRMYEALEEAGLIERVGDCGEGRTVCDGCPEHVAGSCRKAYQFATLNPARDEVIRCGWREAPGMKHRSVTKERTCKE